MRRALLVAFASYALPAGAKAQDRARLPSEMLEGLRANAIDVEMRRDRGRQIMDLTVRVQDFVEILPRLQARGMMNPDLSATAARTRAFSLAAVYAQQWAGTLLEPLYRDNRGIDALTVRVHEAFPDDFGHMRREMVLSFEFDRRLYERINWENFELHRLPRVAQNHRFTPFFNRKFAEERGG